MSHKTTWHSFSTRWRPAGLEGVPVVPVPWGPSSPGLRLLVSGLFRAVSEPWCVIHDVAVLTTTPPTPGALLSVAHLERLMFSFPPPHLCFVLY